MTERHGTRTWLSTLDLIQRALGTDVNFLAYFLLIFTFIDFDKPFELTIKLANVTKDKGPG